MNDNELSADQVRAAALCSFPEAQVAVYMALASRGKSLADLEASAGMSRRLCRDAAFRWGIQFSDYDPFAKPKRLEWRKAEQGWALLDGDDVIGECKRQADGKYCARTFSASSVENWNSRRAMADLTRQLDTQSPDLFDGLPVKGVVTNEHGLVEETVFPLEDDDVKRCRDALDFRARRKAA